MKHHRHPVSWLILSVSLAGLLFVAGCTTVRGSASEPAIVDQAAAEATVIIQRAEATAMVLQAQAQATILIQNANAPASTPDPTAPSPTPGFIQVPTTDTNATLQAATPETQAVEESVVKLVGVSLGTESGLILVQFKAPPALTRRWQQGDVYVTDEATGAVYNEIPVMPIIGPLFARPNQAGQIGYVMLVNAPVPIKSGAQVTVNLGEYIFEHVPVK